MAISFITRRVHLLSGKTRTTGDSDHSLTMQKQVRPHPNNHFFLLVRYLHNCCMPRLIGDKIGARQGLLANNAKTSPPPSKQSHFFWVCSMYTICITVVGPGLLGAKKVSDVPRKMDVSLISSGRDWQIRTEGHFLR